MKNLLVTLGLCFFLNSCSYAKSEKQIIKEKVEAGFRSDEKMLSKLVFKPQLSLEEQKYIEDRASEFNEKVKLHVIGYGPNSLTYPGRVAKDKQMCSWINHNVNQLSRLPLSREREREIEREREFADSICTLDFYEKFGEFFMFAYWNLVKQKIPNSAQWLINEAKHQKELKSYEGDLAAFKLLKKATEVDSADLLPYKHISRWFREGLFDANGKDLIQNEYREYCDKALLLRQWDHLDYLTSANSIRESFGFDYLYGCLEESDQKYDYKKCRCPEATKLIYQSWPKADLLSGEFLDFSGDGFRGGDPVKALVKLYKKHYGRDLTKEPGGMDVKYSE
jgi:hypothetical protein